MRTWERYAGVGRRAGRALALLGVASAVAGLGVPSPGGAQDPAADTGPRVGCFRGRPLPACRSFWIVEMQGSTPLVQTERVVRLGGANQTRRDTFESVLEWNLGHMVNLGDAFALGGVITAGTGNTDALTGIKARARRWLGPDVSVEVEAGLVRSNASDTRFPGVSGGTADLRLNIRDQGSLYVRWDALPLPEEAFPNAGDYYDPGGTQHGLSVGVALGSVPALAGTGALALLYAVLLGVFVSTAA